MTRFSRTAWGIAAGLLLQVVVAAAQQAPGGATMPPAVTQSAPPAVPLTQSAQAVPVQAAPSGAPAPQEAARSPGTGPLPDLSPWSMFMSADRLVKAVI